MFISYKKLSYFILSFFFLLVSGVLYYSTSQLIEKKTSTIFTMTSIINTYKSISMDTNGNGKKDTVNVYVDEGKKEYRLEIVNDDNKKFVLIPDSVSQVSGHFVSWWPLKITIADINMDKVPEIVTQFPKTAGTNTLHIFRWNGKQYAKLLGGRWDGIYLADTNGDMVPEIIVEEKVQGAGDIHTVYSWIVNSYNKTNVKMDVSSRGYDKIKHIINLLNTPFDEKLSREESLHLYFTDNWLNDPKNLQYLNNFARDIVGIQLQDYMGEESAADDRKSPGLVSWKFRYIIFRKFGTEVKAENYTAEIETEKTGNSNSTYKINKIKFKGQ